MTRDVISAFIKLKGHKAVRVVEMINYIRFLEGNSDNDLAKDQSK